MGYGEFGGGGSVDWVVDHEDANAKPPRTDKGRTTGHDEVAVQNMGLRKEAPAGHFRLEVIFDSVADAFAAQKTIAVHGATLVLYVKSNTDGGKKSKDQEKSLLEGGRYPAQVRVSW